MKKLKIGIVGTGGIARTHAQAYLRMDDVELVAPVELGQVVVADVCGTGISFVTTRSL